MDAYLEFQTENRQRNYPLAEDASLMNTGFVRLANDVLIDISGYSLLPFTGVRLIRALGASGPTPPKLVFRFDDALYPFDIEVPIAGGFIAGARASGSFAMPGDGAHTAAVIICTLGGGEVPAGADFNYGTNAPVEPGLVFDMSGSQVNFVEVIRQGAPDFVVRGDVTFRGGYNMNVSQSGQAIKLSPDPGAGEYGLYDAADGESPCAGKVLSLSGAKATKNGEVFIRGGTGITVTDVPAEHKIIITAKPPTPLVPQCDSEYTPPN